MERTYEIINLIKNNINEDNLRESILDITKRLNERGKDATKYIKQFENGELWVKYMRLGCNKIGDGGMAGFSSDKDYISDNILINVVGGLGDIVNTTTGDLTEAYELLFRKLQNQENLNFEYIMKVVYSTVQDYFGNIDQVDIDLRNKYYDFLANRDITGKITDLKHQNIAACVERATLSQNLLQILGYNSVYKVSQIKSDGEISVHAYNLVVGDEKYYMFDATIPKIDEKGNVTPVVAEITKEVYELMSHPLKKDDISVLTERESVRGHRKIQYNSWSKNIYDTTKGKVLDSSDESFR